MNLVELVARSIDPSAYMDGWVDQDGKPVSESGIMKTRIEYRKSESQRKAIEVLISLAGKTQSDIQDALIEFETEAWRKNGLPMDDPQLAEIIRDKYRIEAV